ncbi:putative V-type ATPase, V0 complex, 116kDa subunit family [Plasmopara halstedii]
MEDRAAIAHLIQSNAGELNQSSHILRRNRESCEKATYHALNMFRADVSGMLRAEGWVIKEALSSVRRAVTRAHTAADDKSMPSLVDTVAKPWPVPPTYFETNKFTDAFQAFVETYGCPRYREVNPSVFTAVTFPFLLESCMAILDTQKLEHPGSMGEMMASIYGGRYMLFMMGAFAVYAGLIYNDFFSLPLNLFGSKFAYPDCLESHDREQKYNVYAIGLDPIWKTSSNELLFFNSFKMKISVIFGIVQMTFGILLKGWNNLYFRDYSTFFFEFVPQIVFAVSLFCYMIVLIVLKWSIDWTERMKHEVCPYNFAGEHTGCRPPSLVNTLINIALAPGSVVDPLYDGQLKTQQTLLMLAFVSVPAMLLVKPIYLKMQHDRKTPSVNHHVDFDDEAEERLVSHQHGNSSGHGDEFEFGEVVIHQGIETIEFVLGMVSNTASYLRLWALSLAHSELATVFWEKTMLSTINSDSFIAIFIGFALFAVTTFGVILAMDVLECFLHALRLHWVEFQNKFYKADGHKFHPFSFKQSIKDSQQL